jgi:hypothetical protein
MRWFPKDICWNELKVTDVGDPCAGFDEEDRWSMLKCCMMMEDADLLGVFPVVRNGFL